MYNGKICSKIEGTKSRKQRELRGEKNGDERSGTCFFKGAGRI